jgi:hypothetical protein
MAGLLDVLKGAATVALIVFAVRWLTTAKGSDSPRIHGEVAVYGIRWPVRAVSYAGAVLCLVLVFVDLRADFSDGRWPVNVLFAALALGAAWFGTGVVTSDQKAISKRFLWHSSSLNWEEISEVRLHKRDGGAIELRGNGRKLIVDSRFIAQAHLRREIEQRTQLQPLTD